MLRLALCFVLSLLGGPAAAQWPSTTPAAQGLSAPVLSQANSAHLAAGGKALIVIRHGSIVWETYANGKTAASLIDGKSIAKSLTSIAVGVAIGGGLIPSVNTPITYWFPSLYNVLQKNRITLEHLLTMTSGVNFPAAHYANMQTQFNWANYVLSKPMENDPGARWRYTGSVQILSAVVRAATQQPMDAYLGAKVLAPIGVTSWTWARDPSGDTSASGDFATTARGYAAIGYLMLQRGEWNGQQLVPAWWVDASTAACRSPQRMFNNAWSNAGALVTDPLEYGYLWWCRKWDGTPADAYYAFGGVGHFVIVIPSLDMVVVRLGNGPTPYPDGTFLRDLLLAMVAAVTD